VHKAYIILLFVFATAAGVASGHYFGTRAAQKAATPFAILDVKSFTDAATKDAANEVLPEMIERGYQAAGRKAGELKGKGFIVLNADSVVAAPDYYQIQPPTEAPR